MLVILEFQGERDRLDIFGLELTITLAQLSIQVSD